MLFTGKRTRRLVFLSHVKRRIKFATALDPALYLAVLYTAVKAKKHISDIVCSILLEKLGTTAGEMKRLMVDMQAQGISEEEAFLTVKQQIATIRKTNLEK